MTTIDFVTALFYEVDEQIRAIPKHPEAHLWPSEVVTLGLLHALKGVGNRAFYRWLTREVVYLSPADNYFGPLLNRPSSIHQTVINSRNAFLGPLPARFACGSYWIPGSYLTSNSMSACSNALPRFLAL